MMYSMLLVLLASSFISSSNAKHNIEFLRSSPLVADLAAMADPGAQSLLAELEDEVGSESRKATEARLESLAEALKSTFQSLPKNSRGALNAPSARYALHRLFVQRHGWKVKGLEPGGETWSSETPTSALRDRAPEGLQKIFDSRFHDTRGLDLHELATLAALLENMVQAEAESRLRAAFAALKLPVPEGKFSDLGAFSTKNVTEAVDVYMASFVLGINVTTTSPEKILEEFQEILTMYPSWPETQKFLRKVQRETVGSNNSNALRFSDALRIVTAVGEQHGQWQSSECRDLKSTLLRMEDFKGTGRVRLSDFYGSALHGDQWQFSESVAWLRQIGALDETESSKLQVIVPNYILGPSNCIATSGYYAVCCIDECESILSHLELQLQKPNAEPSEILTLLGSRETNRSFDALLRRRLQDIADYHGGHSVPIHGRLFAQWLHHAYPQECPYPHISGTTSPVQQDKFEEETGLEAMASEDEMRQHVEAGKVRYSSQRKSSHEGGMCSQMWTMEEELVDPSASLTVLRLEGKGSHVDVQDLSNTESSKKLLSGPPLVLAAAMSFAILAVILNGAMAMGSDKYDENLSFAAQANRGMAGTRAATATAKIYSV
eukprot:TRINITY_DN51021_c0_g1_i1.p1 TRINITY_DN51021_c0_g1~~TRINITY_DN51021_c0_g1_i1.p1  ORF type:complete len:608 (+),score=108.14 TRINITY_DN51021_c0_g1_i1:60-1883(+)